MNKFKLKPSTTKQKKEEFRKRMESDRRVILETVKEIQTIPVVEEKKESKIAPVKVVYISKGGSRAIFDSIRLCASIFGVDASTIKHNINHPVRKTLYSKHGDWLKGGHFEYLDK